MRHLISFNEDIDTTEIRRRVHYCFSDIIDGNKVEFYDTSSTLPGKFFKGTKKYSGMESNDGGCAIYFSGNFEREFGKDIDEVIKLQEENIKIQEDYLDIMKDIKVGISRIREFHKDINIEINLDDNSIYLFFKNKT